MKINFLYILVGIFAAFALGMLTGKCIEGAHVGWVRFLIIGLVMVIFTYFGFKGLKNEKK
jgi:hypothetical protein|tara:strand:- start:5844 stop:6023 length:180 start_codon:yes stop_codon:yes gene_type:complete